MYLTWKVHEVAWKSWRSLRFAIFIVYLRHFSVISLLLSQTEYLTRMKMGVVECGIKMQFQLQIASSAHFGLFHHQASRFMFYAQSFKSELPACGHLQLSYFCVFSLFKMEIRQQQTVLSSDKNRKTIFPSWTCLLIAGMSSSWFQLAYFSLLVWAS